MSPGAPHPAERRPVEGEHRGGLVRLSVTAVLEVLGAGIEGQELLEQLVLDRELDHHAPRRVPADQVAGIEEMMQKGARPRAGIEGQRGDGHRLSLRRSGSACDTKVSNP